MIVQKLPDEDVIVSARDICMTRGDNQILKSVSMDVKRGEVVVLLGPSGAGKTSFLRTINLLNSFESGEMWDIRRRKLARICVIIVILPNSVETSDSFFNISICFLI